MTMNRQTRLLPLWLKVGYTIWLTLWLPAYVATHAPVEFLWFCHVGNVVILFGLWFEDSLLISWQAVSLLILQSLWTIDFFGRLLLGVHLFGGTAYMFRENYPLQQWLLSAYHIPYPFLLGYMLWKVGYDRRAIHLQIIATVVVLLLSFFMDRSATWNVNWVYGLFAKRQHWANDYVHLVLCMIGYSLVVYVPSHLLLRWLAPPRRDRPALAAPPKLAVSEREAAPSAA